MQRSLSNNISRYPWFQFASSLLAWLPIFFLYFNQFVSLRQTVQLGAIYYLVVCLWEVPSGYFSDRIGRRVTLLLSVLANIIAYCCFLLASNFLGLVLGQCFLAVSIALMSGTDTAFLYDSLVSLKQQDSYIKHEAKAQKYGFIGLSFACLAGGALGTIDLRLAYCLSLFGAVWSGYLVYCFVEPTVNRELSSTRFTSDIVKCFNYLRSPTLAWLFGMMTLMYCLEHIAYEFYQPYIKLLNIQWLSTDSAPLISAIIIAISMLGGSFGASCSLRLVDIFGVKKLLIIAMLFQLLIVTSLSFSLSLFLVCIVIFRNFPMAVISAPVRATIAPFVGSELRATYLSIQSLSARLVFFSLLLYLSRSAVETADLDWPSLSTILQQALFIGLAGLALAIVFSRKVNLRSGRAKN